MKKIISFLVTLYVCALFSCAPLYTPLNISSQEKAAINTLIDQVDETRMVNVLTDMTGPRHVLNTPAGTTIEDFQTEITDRLTNLRLTPYLQEVTVHDLVYYTIDDEGWFVPNETNQSFTMNNIIAEQPGSNPNLAPVLITSHWDSVYTTPGINDNASAVAACLEAASIFSNYTFERTIIYCFFAFEEQGLDGAYVFADSMSTLPEVVYNMDMISYTSAKENPIYGMDILLGLPTTGDFIGIFASPFSRTEALDFCRVIDTFVPELPYFLLVLDQNINNNLTLYDTFRSDHMPFWEKGVPALFITDTAELRDGSPYHRPGDTLASIDQGFMVKTTKVVLAASALRAGIE